jgi:hypothetical protein
VIYKLFISTFIYVAFKALQQKNVAHSNYLPVLPVSFAMATCEVFTVYTVATSGFHLSSVIAVGLGGGLGAMLAMYLHDRYFNGLLKGRA